MDLVVSITAHNRPDYLKQVIASWQAVRGIEETLVHFQVEPVDSEVQNLCMRAPFERTTYEVNSDRLGVLSNPHAALRSGFETGADFVVVGEDDSTVTPDVLEFFHWAMKEAQNNERVIAVCSFKHRPEGPVDRACLRPWFASVIWGTWRNRWEDWMDRDWGHTYEMQEWDFRLARKCDTEGFRCLFPCISRSQHIGQFNGTHHDPVKFLRLQAQQVHDGSPVEWRMV